MKILFIGGSGNISSVVSKLLIEQGHDLFLLNRGNNELPFGCSVIKADIKDESVCNKIFNDHTWDVVVNWIAFTVEDIKRDIHYFTKKTNQYIFISSASCYQKPPSSPYITEETPLINPFWKYSQDKIACEEMLLREFKSNGFPVTIVRPSHTYNTVIPAAFGAWTEYTLIHRILQNKPIVVPGDGTSLWVVTHAIDFAKGFIGLLGLKNVIGEAFHITTDEVLCWNQIYDYIGKAVGVQPQLVHVTSDKIIEKYPDLEGNLWGDKSNSVIFDNSKIKRYVPDFKAEIIFEEGIKRTIKWFHEKPKRMQINPKIDEMFENLII